MKRSLGLIALVLFVVNVGAARAEEGMWTLDNFPNQAIKDKYGVEIDQDWLDRVRLATTRMGGCTGSFVSPDGLILTNHHCARRCISQLSSAENDLEANGFLAETPEDEASCPADHMSVLVSSEEITARVAEAIEGKDDKEANEARKQILTRIETECEAASAASPTGKLTCETVPLYNGGQHFLYKYKRYNDVRLVFAPESPIAAFGGDPDNFNFPRWCLDMTLMRVYENDEPAKTPHFLKWREEGAAEGEAVFISGHPGRTDRQLTVSDLKYQRDVVIPLWLLRYSELRGRLAQHATTGEESHRRVQSPLLGLENGIKVRRNHLRALMNDEIFIKKQAEEEALREAVAADPQMRKQYGSAWDDIAGANKLYRSFFEEHLFLENAAAFSGTLFDYARDLVRAAYEREKPNEDRLREYNETALPRLEQRLLAPRPVYSDIETLSLAFSLDKMREWLGPDSRYVKDILGSQSPASKADALVEGTELADVEIRKALWEGGREAIEASDDPMILLALSVDEDARALRKRFEDEVEAVRDAAYEKIAAARFAIHGTSIYPDATFTLRVTYGSIKGWDEKGKAVEPFTRTARLFERTTGEDPFRLPESWLEARERLDMETHFNTVATTDITGGNSGSPLVDKDGNLVGLAFDGNIHSIAGNYWFDEATNRTVVVHPAIMMEALRVVYGADRLVRELEQTEPVTEEMVLGSAR
ncbi:MAG: S46 family peptidase [bacterium]|nr:S46 family peptidase [bacterium]